MLGPERRRCISAAEKLAMVAETYEPGTVVSLVARRHGIASNQLFLWRKLAGLDALSAAVSDKGVVRASEHQKQQQLDVGSG